MSLRLRLKSFKLSSTTIVLTIIALLSIQLGLLLVQVGGFTIVPQSPTFKLDDLVAGSSEFKAIAIMFDSVTCDTCREMRPFWARVEENPPDNVIVTHVTLQSEVGPRLFSQFSIVQTPTFLILDSSLREIARYVGRFPGPDVEKSMRAWIQDTLLKAGINQRESLSRGYGYSLSLLAYPILGVLVALSPCMAPALLVYIVSGSYTSRSIAKCASCSLLAMAGVFLLSLTLVISLALVSELIVGLRIAFSIAVLMLGIYSLASPYIQSLPAVYSKSQYALCFSYGILSLQCSLPIMLGSLTALSSLGLSLEALIGMLLFSSGVAGTLFLVMLASGGILARVIGILQASQVTRFGGFILATLGAYMLIATWW